MLAKPEKYGANSAQFCAQRYDQPGSNGAIPATVEGFGAVFTDVDLPNTTSIEYFDVAGNSLFQAFVPVGTVANGGLSFLGVIFDAGEQVARVRIRTGNAALGPNDSANVDIVAMDDFFYSEPAAIVANPATLALLALGLLGIVASRRRRREA